MASTAINPNFTQQGSRPLPVFFGYGLASGDTMIPYTLSNNAQLAYIAISDGEIDGIEQHAINATDMLYSAGALNVQGGALNSTILGLEHPGVQIYFHAGQWTPIGIPQVPFSVGPDQGYDSFFGYIPSVTPPQAFNNIAYVTVYLPDVGSVYDRVSFTGPGTLAFQGLMRGARCRYFDASGNVTGYGFTTCPTWHIVEALLRYKFKRQQPQISGLTPAERACFNWPSIVAHAARNNYVLANGANRFTGNYVFAAKSTLGAMLETMLRACRSYLDDPDGKIGIYGHDATNPSFNVTGAHIVPDSFKVQKKDLTNAPNVFIPKFRDMGIQALIEVDSVSVGNGGFSDGSITIEAGIWAANFLTGGQNPFSAGNILYYGDGSNPALNGDYVVQVSPPATDVTPSIMTFAPGVVAAAYPSGVTATGGYIGTQSSRFGQRSPNTVQHSRHQQATAAVAPGIAPLANIKPVEYDLGNMTYDQANRLMQYAMNWTLGMNQPGWMAPMTGSMTVFGNAVDANGNSFRRMRAGEVNGTFAIDITVSAEITNPNNGAAWVVPDPSGRPGAGQAWFVITKKTDIPPSRRNPLGAIEIEFQSYLPPEGYPDVSYTPDASLRTIASATLPFANSSVEMVSVGWVMQATPTCTVAGDGTLTISIPDLKMRFLGDTTDTVVTGAVWTGLTSGQPYSLFYFPPSTSSGISVGADFVATPGTYSTLAGAGTYPEAGAYLILTGVFTPTAF